ncbi:uncharacterized protein N7469_009576 [Penicillium citrinum]|uniref:Uncharacterized protein n=1 Tax=Penicillium citrinum TaxID=5077 RepID=A0A9W9NL17_PENCI|nr:uncharacterized protein N7469_009576 [Penicillium citrinum]KAJ5220689.1 hypothetical protein N7469_009576 [Penicillium citrinum]
MTTPQPSLFATIRAHLSLDSDSDSSTPRHSIHLDRTNLAPVKGHPHSCPSTVNTMEASTSNDDQENATCSAFRALSISTEEPFPDFDATESDALIAMEDAFDQAFTKAIQTQIRQTLIEPAIDTPKAQHLPKRRALDDMKDLLSNPRLRLYTRQRFIALTNMVIRLDHAFFSSDDSVSNAENAIEITQVMMPYLSGMERTLQDLVEISSHVDFILASIAQEELSVLIRYRRMACVVAGHLRKPRLIEQRLLSAFLEFFDVWVFKPCFLERSEIGLATDNVRRASAFQYVDVVRDTLRRATISYAAYRDTLQFLKEKYFFPATMPNAPDVDVSDMDFLPVEQS